MSDRAARFNMFVIISIILHSILLFLLKIPPLEDSVTNKKNQEKHNAMRILFQYKKSNNEEPGDAKYFSAKSNKVEKETKLPPGFSLPTPSKPMNSLPSKRMAAMRPKLNKKQETFKKFKKDRILGSIPIIGDAKETDVVRSKRRAYIPNTGDLFPSVESLARLKRRPARDLDEAIEKGELINLNTKEYKYISYFLSIKRAVESCMSYPEDMSLQGISGGGMVAFGIRKDGKVSEAKIVQSSGYKSFDKEVVRSILMASPLNPIPKSLNKNRLFLVWPFEFVLFRFFS